MQREGVSTTAKVPGTRSKYWDALFDIASGTMGGVAQVGVGHPLDTIKVRLQTSERYGGMSDAFVKTFRQEGLGGLFKGAASPLAGAVVHNAIIFFSNGRFKQFWADKNGNTTGWRMFMSGAFTGVAASVCEGPIDLFKCKMQAQIGSGQFTGVYDCVKQIIQQQGIRGIYQGGTATLLRNMPAFGSYFWAYSTVTDALTKKGDAPRYSTVFMAGGAAGACFWGLWYPIELVKTRMQTDHPDPAKRLYKNTLDCFQKSYKEGGVKIFFRGYLPCLVRGIPVNASIFLAVYATKRALSPKSVGSSH